MAHWRPTPSNPCKTSQTRRWETMGDDGKGNSRNASCTKSETLCFNWPWFGIARQHWLKRVEEKKNPLESQNISDICQPHSFLFFMIYRKKQRSRWKDDGRYLDLGFSWRRKEKRQGGRFGAAVSFNMHSPDEVEPAALSAGAPVWLLWRQGLQHPGSLTSFHRWCRPGARRSASRWCCLWHWPQRIQNLEGKVVDDGQRSQVLLRRGHKIV